MKTAIIAFRVSEEEKATIEAVAAKKGLTVSELVRTYIEQSIDKEYE